MLSRLQQRITVGINALGNAIIARFSGAPNVVLIDLGTTNLLAHGVLSIPQDRQQTQPRPKLEEDKLAIKSEEMIDKKYCYGGAPPLFWNTTKELAEKVPADQPANLNLPENEGLLVKIGF